MRKVLRSGNHSLYFSLFLIELSLELFGSRKNIPNYSGVLTELKNKGVAVIPSYLKEQLCDEMIEEFLKLSPQHGKKTKNDFRVFGIENISKVFARYSHDKLLMDLAESYSRGRVALETTMAARIVADDSNMVEGSGGGWHRDSFSKQFKSITYLKDVTIDNGPFMYIKGSNKLSSIKKLMKDKRTRSFAGNSRLTQEQVKLVVDVLEEPVSYITGNKGDLILADTRGIHTGMPIKVGERYAVFNYYVSKLYKKKKSEIEALDIDKFK